MVRELLAQSGPPSTSPSREENVPASALPSRSVGMFGAERATQAHSPKAAGEEHR
jgi:hypothetical protein